jgi:Rrf2 family protein
MNFSRESEYAVRGMVALAAASPGEALTLQEIAGQGNLPAGFLAKIFQKLVRHRLIESHRGVQRGYTLARPASEIVLRQILEAIEGPDLFDRCVFSHRRCGQEGRCIVHPYWGRLRAEVTKLFEGVSLRDLMASAAAQAAPDKSVPGESDEPAWIRNRVQALYS